MKDGELRRWFRTSDVKANACEVIHKVELPSSQTGAVSDMDLTSSSLEEMFQIHPSVVSGGSYFTHPSVVSGRSRFTHPSVVSGRSCFTHCSVLYDFSLLVVKKFYIYPSLASWSPTSAGWLAGYIAGWLAGYIAGWLCCWLAGYMAGWLATLHCWLAGWLHCRLAGYIDVWLATLLAGWLHCWPVG